MDWNIISYRHCFRNNLFENNIVKKNNWLYMKEKEKLEKIKKFYKVEEREGVKYIECYKSVREDYSSIHNKNLFKYDNFNYEYETVCDYNTNIEHSNGFGCWTIWEARNYAYENDINNYKLIKCSIPLNSVCMLSTGKIRSSILIVKKLMKK
jgi:hypothetical protein